MAGARNLVSVLSDPEISVADSDPGSGAFFDPWMRKLGWVKNQDPDPGSVFGMNIPDHIFESIETIFWVKILQFFDADPVTRDPGWKNLDPGSGINIPDHSTAENSGRNRICIRLCIVLYCTGYGT